MLLTESKGEKLTLKAFLRLENIQVHSVFITKEWISNFFLLITKIKLEANDMIAALEGNELLNKSELGYS